MPKLFEGLIDRISNIMSRQQSEPSNDTSKEIRKTYQVMDDSSLFGSDFDVFGWYSEQTQLSMNRRKIYDEYDQMDIEDPEISSALDIYADNCIDGDSENDEVITIKTEDDRVKEVLEGVKKRLNLDIELWSIARNIAKYGEDFEELVVDDKLTPYRIKNLKGKYMIRNEDIYGRLKEDAFLQLDEKTEEIIARFKKWQVVHFRIKTDRSSKYGRSILYPIRKVYKQLAMMEDSLVIARLVRAPLRYKYLIDTEGLTPEEALEHIDRVKRKLKKRRTIDPRTGKMRLEFNPMSVEEDIFIATKPGSRADVGVLQGQLNLGQLKDIEYFQNKKFTGLKVPKAYLGLERDVNAKATLTEQDVQFARTVRRIQYALQEGLRQIFDFALIMQGIVPDTVEYQIGLPVISTIDELRGWQIEQIKVRIANMLKITTGIPNRWIYRELLGMTNEEIDALEIEAEEEQRKYAELMNDLYSNQGQAEESIQLTPKEIRKLRNRLRQELKTLRMLDNWKLGKEADEEDVTQSR